MSSSEQENLPVETTRDDKVVSATEKFSSVGAGTGTGIQVRTFQEACLLADQMAKARGLLPEVFIGNAGACLGIINRALSWEMDPFALASQCYLPKSGGTIAFQAQLLNAVILKFGLRMWEGRPEYVYSGEGVHKSCKVSVTMKETGQEVSIETPAIKDITVKNSPLWKSDPEQQLAYYAIRAFARRHFPDLIMSAYTEEELRQLQEERSPTRAHTPSTGYRPATDRIMAAQADRDDTLEVEDAEVAEEKDEGDAVAEDLAPEPDQETINNIHVRVFNEGATAAKNGAARTDNIYTEGTQEHESWHLGYDAHMQVFALDAEPEQVIIE